MRRPLTRRTYSPSDQLLAVVVVVVLACCATVARGRPQIHMDGTGGDLDEELDYVHIPLSERDGNLKYSILNGSSLTESQRVKAISFATFNSLQDADQQRLAHQIRKNDKKKQRNKGSGRKGALSRRPPAEEATDDDRDVPNGMKGAVEITFADPEEIAKTPNVCFAKRFKQKVREPGCLSKVVINRFCNGSCHSMYIPRTKAKKLKAMFKSAAQCAPDDYDTMKVVLDCPLRNPPTIEKSVVIIKSCKCKNIDARHL